MRPAVLSFVLATLLGASQVAFADALSEDPPRDAANPARSEVLHIPSGGVEINGLAYIAAGAGAHPTLLICHGWPGNEKNLDLAQAVRRAGWNAVTFNYRGSWGSPGEFHFAQVPQDAAAALAYLREPRNAARLGIDTQRIVIAGHSMGGWAAALTAAADSGVSGAVLIAAADMGRLGALPRDKLVAITADNTETLVATSPEKMADELSAHAREFSLAAAGAGLAAHPLLVLTADDGLVADADMLVAAVRAKGGKQVQTRHFATDHSWSDSRIALQSEILKWLQSLPR